MGLNVYHWLGIGAGAIIFSALLIFGWGRFWLTPAYFHIRSFYLRNFAYPLLIPRRYFSSITILQTSVFVVYLALNVVFLLVPQPSTSELTKRFGISATINMVPLFLPHSNALTHEVLPLHVHMLLHHWLARLSIVLGITHLVLAVKNHTLQTISNRISGGITMICCGVLGISSLYAIRRRKWEIFKVMHVVFAQGSVISLIVHLAWSEKWYLSVIGPGIWLLLSIPRLYNYFHFRRLQFQNTVSITHFGREYDIGRNRQKLVSELDIIQVKIKLGTPINIRPGQYILLRIHNRNSINETFQSHPFMITWWDFPIRKIGSSPPKELVNPTKAASITLLIKPAGGITRRLAQRSLDLSLLESVSFDGPYGQNLHVESYENVFLIAKGIGIAGILSYAKQLLTWSLYPKPDQRAITRIVNLYWVLDHNSQLKWGEPFITWLQDNNSKTDAVWLLRVWCIFPNNSTVIKSPELRNEDIEDCKFVFPSDGIDWEEDVIEVASDLSGQSLIICCGVTSFTTKIRGWARSIPSRYNVVKYTEVEYRPPENLRRDSIILEQAMPVISSPLSLDGDKHSAPAFCHFPAGTNSRR